jgi:hypothetical protein
VKQKIALTYETTETVEVEYPFYRRTPPGPFDDIEVYPRIDANGRVTTVTIGNGGHGRAFSLHVHYSPDWHKRVDIDADQVDHMLGRGKHECSKEQFEQAFLNVLHLTGETQPCTTQTTP